MEEIFDTDDFRLRLKSDRIGKKIVYSDVTGSTMDDARKFGVNDNDPGQYPHGTVVLAERQTKARGARDHKWDASNTGNIYASIILHLPQTYKSFEGRFKLEVAACLAVMGVARSLGVEAIPKWPNDLWVRGHKLAGFLVEDGRFDIPGSNLCLVILGMGINVNADIRRNSELYSIATSLMCESNGVRVNREEFLSDVCLALEETLVSTSDNFIKYQTCNLFQEGCHISVTCPSENRVMDGEFLEVCDNWNIKFKDKITGKILNGRSDYFTIRPTGHRKILVVLSGISGSKIASAVARWLTSIVDTSRWVVRTVPESVITQSEVWMKDSDLVVLAEDVCDSVHLTSKLIQYLKKGGNLLAVGVASYFTAKMFEIPLKEGVLQSMANNSDVSIISTEYKDFDNVSKDGDGSHRNGSLSSSHPSSSSHVTFPTSLIYFKFSRDYVIKKMKESLAGENENSSISTQTIPGAGVDSSNISSEFGSERTLYSKSNLSFRYFQLDEEESDEYSIAIMTMPTTRGGSIALFGFDLGLTLPRAPSSASSYGLTEGEVRKEQEGGEKEESMDLEQIVKDVDRDKFKRDRLLYQVLNVLNIM